MHAATDKLRGLWQPQTATTVSGSVTTLVEPRLAVRASETAAQGEWEAFGISELRQDHFVRSGDKYFQPAKPVSFTKKGDREAVRFNFYKYSYSVTE